MSTKSKILYYLNNQDWTPAGRIERMASEWQTTGSTIARRCRELYNEGRLEKQFGDKHHVNYRIKYAQRIDNIPVVENTKLFEVPIKRRYT